MSLKRFIQKKRMRELVKKYVPEGQKMNRRYVDGLIESSLNTAKAVEPEGGTEEEEDGIQTMAED